MTLTKDKLGTTSLLGNESYAAVRKNGNPQNTMRKYQQLALVAVSIFSLVAFLFYKHEYDRLRYTLEYLEMFGSPPLDDGAQSVYCGSLTHRSITTVPPVWMAVSPDIGIYSAFWDDTFLLVRVLAVVLTMDTQTKVGAHIWFDGFQKKNMEAACRLEKIAERSHSKLSLNNLNLTYILCRPAQKTEIPPVMIQFIVGSSAPSKPVLIQESESWKSVANLTSVCVYESADLLLETQRIVEFVAFHHSIGVEKFLFFGPVLTPLARKLLDKYGDEMGLFYEEVSFSPPAEFQLNDGQKRSIVESDCIYRLRNTHENVIILNMKQFLIPRRKLSIQGVLGYFPTVDSKIPSVSSEFHFVTQRVCLDPVHSRRSDLLLDSQTRTMKPPQEEGVALLRPHLMTGPFSVVGRASSEQHIPSSVAAVVTYDICPEGEESHSEYSHLPTEVRFAEQIRKSLLYRKWKINS